MMRMKIMLELSLCRGDTTFENLIFESQRTSLVGHTKHLGSVEKRREKQITNSYEDESDQQVTHQSIRT